MQSLHARQQRNFLVGVFELGGADIERQLLDGRLEYTCQNRTLYLCRDKKERDVFFTMRIPMKCPLPNTPMRPGIEPQLAMVVRPSLDHMGLNAGFQKLTLSVSTPFKVICPIQ